MTSCAARPQRVVISARSPWLKESKYDRTIAALWAMAIALFGLCFLLIVVWQQFLSQSANATNSPKGILGSPIPQPDVALVIPDVQQPDQKLDWELRQDCIPTLELSDTIAIVTSDENIRSANAVPTTDGKLLEDNHGPAGRPLGMSAPEHQSHANGRLKSRRPTMSSNT